MSSVNLKNLSQDELNKILKEKYEKNRKLKKERSIILIKKLQKQNEKLTQIKIKNQFLDQNQNLNQNQNQNQNKKRKILMTIIKNV